MPVGAGDTFLAAMQQGKIVSGMTTEPTVARAVKAGTAKVGIDLRTPEATRAALGGDYPAACLYMDRSWMEANKETAQKVVNAFVKTLKWMNTHSPEEIAAQMPKDYYAGDLELYVQGLKEGRAQYSPDGMMPKDAPESVLKVLSSFSPNVQGKTIDLSKTYTTEFVDQGERDALGGVASCIYSLPPCGGGLGRGVPRAISRVWLTPLRSPPPQGEGAHRLCRNIRI